MIALIFALVAATQADVTTKDVRFYSEGVQCAGRLYLPKGFSADAKLPGVVLAPGWMQTAASIEKFAAIFAARGLVAMAIDYRGWGKSGGYVYLAEPVQHDDRLRFSQHTARVRIRRKRLVPNDQILDIRNAVAYLQGEPGIDRARVGVWGADMAGGHVVVAAATDARIKAAVAQAPIIDGKDVPRKATLRSPELHAAEVRLARSGTPPAPPAQAAAAPAPPDVETRLALADYHPFWYAEQVPVTTAVLFVVADRDTRVDNTNHAMAAAKVMKGPCGVTVVPNTTHAMSTPKAVDAAADAAASWFLKYL